jgi:hypothetical protein
MKIIMRKNIILVSLFIVTLGTQVAIFIRQYHDKKIKTSIIQNQYITDTIQFCTLNFNINNRMTGLLMPEIVAYNGTNKLPLLSLLKSSNLLIYRYSDIHCNTCVETELESLQKYFDSKLGQIIILASYDNEKDFMLFKKLNKIKIPIYRIAHNAIDWTPEKLDMPYYFVLHSNGRVSNFYISNREYIDITNNYLKCVRLLLD